MRSGWTRRIWAAAVILALAGGLWAPSAGAEEVVVNGVTWRYSVANGKAMVERAEPARGNLTIPSSLGGYPVTRIWGKRVENIYYVPSYEEPAGAFYGCSNLISVTIPSGVTNIEHNTFRDCSNLADVTLPDSLKYISYSGFQNCRRLASIVVPGEVTGIGPGAFLDCRELRQVIFTNSNYYFFPNPTDPNLSALKNIDAAAFRGCSNLTSMPIPNNVTNIGALAFGNCTSLTSMTLPGNLKSLGAGVFEGCSGLKSVVILASEMNINRAAGLFRYCSGLKTLCVPESWASKYIGQIFWSEAMDVPEGCTIIYGEPKLGLEKSSQNFTPKGASSQKLGVTADVFWEAKSSQSWLTLQTSSGIGNGTIIYDVAVNTAKTSREGTITVTSGGQEQTFKVTQDGVVLCPVTLDLQGGTGGTTSVTATYGSAMPAVEIPTRTGYSFGGYFTEANGGGKQYYSTAGKSVRDWDQKSAATLYAKWTVNTYAVTLDRQGGTGGTASVTAIYNSSMPAVEVPTRTGYSFGGYYAGTNGGGTQYYTAEGKSAQVWNKTSATTLYAKWTANKYAVTLDWHGGTGGTASVTATYDSAMPAVDVPTREGYLFGGYYTETKGGGVQL